MEHFIQEVVEITLDPAHWAFEAISDIVFGAVGAFFVRIWVKRHDRTHHGK